MCVDSDSINLDVVVVNRDTRVEVSILSSRYTDTEYPTRKWNLTQIILVSLTKISFTTKQTLEKKKFFFLVEYPLQSFYHLS